MAGVLVIGDLGAGGVERALLQAAGAAAPLAAALGVPLVGALIGRDVSAAAADFQCGLAALYLVEGPQYAPYSAPAYIAAAAALIEAVDPGIVVVVHGGAAREWVPALAARWQGGLVMNCCGLAIDATTLIATKPINGGSVLAQFEVVGAPRFVTVRASDFEPLPLGTPVAPQRLAVAAPVDGRVEVLSEEVASSAGPRLKDAKKIIAGGRGIGGPQHWHRIEEAAGLIGAAVACSRPVADSGWVPSSHQVGLSGTTVAPDLYVAIGISGAAQHLAGITAAKTVVAINTEAGADIFKRANWGVVDDYVEVLQGFAERARQLRS